MSEPFIGEIRAFGFNFAPRGWAFCQGQLLAISANSALFSLLGTTYGGDGRTTFGLPDLRGRVAIGQGTGPGLSARLMGQKAGVESVTLNTNQIPSHRHALLASSESADSNKPEDNELGASQIYHSPTTDSTLAASSIGLTGGGQPHENMEPFLVINYSIALTGVFPSRN